MLSACVANDNGSSSAAVSSSEVAVSSSSVVTVPSSSVAPSSSSVESSSSEVVVVSSASVAASSSAEACEELDNTQFINGEKAYADGSCSGCHGGVTPNGKTEGAAKDPIDVAGAPYGRTNSPSLAGYIESAMSAYLPASCNGNEAACAADIEHYLLVATNVIAVAQPFCESSSSETVASSAAAVSSSSAAPVGMSLLSSPGIFANGGEDFTAIPSAIFNGEASFSILSADTAEPWAVQMTHLLSVTAGEQYAICFDAKTTPNTGMRSLTVGFDNNAAGGYMNISGGPIDETLTAQYQSFSLVVTADETASDARLYFNMAAEAGDIQLDNIAVYQGDSCGGVVEGSSSSSAVIASSSVPAVSSSSAMAVSSSSAATSSAPAGSLAEYFAAQECGVGFTALGNGSYKACYRLENGQAECVSPGGTTPTTVAWQGGGAVTDILHVSGTGENEVSLVTMSGAVHTGGVTSVSTTPVIASNAVAVTGGRNTKCALVSEGGGKDVMCFSGGSAVRPGLPSGFDAVQVSSGYGVACAVNTDGEVWCWDEGGNVPPFVNKTPSKVDFAEPMVFVSAIQDVVCGIKWSGGMDCRANWYANPFLPTDNDGMGGISLQAGAFSDAVAIQAAYAQGVVVTADGKAIYLPKVGSVGVSNPGVEFNNGSGFIAAGGDRGLKCALTGGGDVYCLDGSNNAVKVNSMKAEAGVCPY